MNDSSSTPESEQSPSDASQIVVASQVYPARLPVIAIPNRPVFPKMVTPLVLERPEQLALFEQGPDAKQALVGLVLRRGVDDDERAPFEVEVGDRRSNGENGASSRSASVVASDLYGVGVVAQVLKLQKPEHGPPAVLLGALDRFQVQRVLQREPHIIAEVSYLYEPKLAPSNELRAYALAVINSIKDLISQNPLFKEELNLLINQGSFEEPGRLADYAA